MFIPKKDDAKYCKRACYFEGMKGHPTRNPKRRILKTCASPECVIVFETGGRAGKKEQRYCCHAHAIADQGHHPAPNTLSQLDAARLAGFFDGEGAIIKVKQNGNAWRITLSQNHEGILRWVQEVTGTGHIGGRMSDGRNLIKKPEPTEAHYWNLYGHNAAALLTQLLPYLMVKKEKALELIAAYE